jgi:hypothetical protein
MRIPIYLLVGTSTECISSKGCFGVLCVPLQVAPPAVPEFEEVKVDVNAVLGEDPEVGSAMGQQSSVAWCVHYCVACFTR